MDFTTTLTVDPTPDEAFSEEIDGATDELGAEFTYTYQDLHRSTQQITELIPGKRVVWHVLDSYLDFVADKTEWNGTDVTLDISARDGRTEVRSTHVGLAPETECFEGCSSAWSFYINRSPRSLITTGVGEPNKTQAQR